MPSLTGRDYGCPSSIRALGEVFFEASEVLEVLARPEEHERGIHRRPLAVAGCFTDATEKPADAFGVAGVRRRHLASFDEGTDVPPPVTGTV